MKSVMCHMNYHVLLEAKNSGKLTVKLKSNSRLPPHPATSLPPFQGCIDDRAWVYPEEELRWELNRAVVQQVAAPL